MSEQTPAKHLVSLVTGKVKAKQHASDAMSHITAKLKSAKKDANLNKKAFDVIFNAYKMDEDDRNEFFDCISLYQDFMDDNNAWADGQHTGDLFRDDKAAADQPESDTIQPVDEEIAAANAKAIESGISELPAGEDRGALNGIASINPYDLDNIPEALERRPGRKRGPSIPTGDEAATGTYSVN